MSIFDNRFISNSATSNELPTIADLIEELSSQFDQCITSTRQTNHNDEFYYTKGHKQLKLGDFKQALSSFEKAIDLGSEDSDTYFFAALSIFDGKRPFVSNLANVRKAISYINIALQYNSFGKYFYLKHLVHLDFYEKKLLNCSPSSASLLKDAIQNQLSARDAEQIKKMLCINGG